MLERWRFFAAALAFFSSTVINSGCAGEAARVMEYQGESTTPEEPFRRRTATIRPGSSIDTRNRHPSIVKLHLSEDAANEMNLGGGCSGVIISPRVVVTAGHCVCAPRQLSAFERKELETVRVSKSERGADIHYKADGLRGERFTSIVDGKRCLEAVEVEARIYEPRIPGRPARAHELMSTGRVKPHPRLEIIYNDEESMVWSSADLAVVILDVPLEELPAMRLPDAEVLVGTSIAMAGYGPGSDSSRYGERHVGENKVTLLRRLESGSVEFVAALQRFPDGRAASHVERGDSGGGCWVQTENGENVLVGIAGAKAEGRNGEVGSVFTSVFSHKPWLREQVRALDEGPSGAPVVP